jgi:hypothetical protein
MPMDYTDWYFIGLTWGYCRWLSCVGWMIWGSSLWAISLSPLNRLSKKWRILRLFENGLIRRFALLAERQVQLAFEIKWSCLIWDIHCPTWLLRLMTRLFVHEVGSVDFLSIIVGAHHSLISDMLSDHSWWQNRVLCCMDGIVYGRPMPILIKGLQCTIVVVWDSAHNGTSNYWYITFSLKWYRRSNRIFLFVGLTTTSSHQYPLFPLICSLCCLNSRFFETIGSSYLNSRLEIIKISFFLISLK